MRPIWVLAWLLILLTGCAFAKKTTPRPANPVKIVLAAPEPDEKNYGQNQIVINLDRPTKQEFTLAIEPKTKLFTRQTVGDQRIWNYAEYLTVKPKTKYTLTLTSDQAFIWRGKPTKKAQWSYFTASASIIHPTFPKSNSGWASADDPVWTNQAHFRVEPPDPRQEKQYDFIVTVAATFNAGVNGPPIAEQKRRYQKELQTYTQEAVAHLKKNRVEISKSRILWLPEDAQTLVRSLVINQH